VYSYVYPLQDDVHIIVFLFIYKPLTVAFLLFAGEYRVDDVPHDLSRTC